MHIQFIRVLIGLALTGAAVLTFTGYDPTTGHASEITAPAHPDFVTLEPFAGVAVDVPAGWLPVSADGTTARGDRAENLIGMSAPRQINASVSFVPAEAPDDAAITVTIRPGFSLPREWAAAPQAKLDGFAQSFADALARSGYRLRRNVNAERKIVAGRMAITCAMATVDSEGEAGQRKMVAIPLEDGTMALIFTRTDGLARPWAKIVERACASFHITEPLAEPKPRS